MVDLLNTLCDSPEVKRRSQKAKKVLFFDTNNYGKRIKILYGCPFEGWPITGHSQFSQSANFCQKGWDGLALLGKVINVGSDTFGNPIFHEGLHNQPFSRIISVLECFAYTTKSISDTHNLYWMARNFLLGSQIRISVEFRLLIKQ